MNYLEFKHIESLHFNRWTTGKIFICFTDDDLNQHLQKKQLTRDQVVYIGGCCFIIKKYYDDYLNLIEEQDSRTRAFLLKSSKNLYDAVIYECWDHETALNGDLKTVFNILGLDQDDRKKHYKTINKALKDYNAEFYKYN